MPDFNKVKLVGDTSTLHAIGQAVMGNQSVQNAFLNALVNRIAMTIVTSRMWDDPWAVFNMGKMDYGETVEEIFVNIAKPYTFDPEGAADTLFKREIPDVRAAFHRMNFQKYYPTTISVQQLQQAFLSYSGLAELTAYIVDSLYTALHLDEYLVKKYMLCREILNGGLYPVNVKPVTGSGAQPTDSVEKFRQYTNNMLFLKTTYNRAHVRNSTPIEDQVIIIPNDVESVIGVQVLANAFNISQADYISRRIPVDSFEFDEDDLQRLKVIFAGDSSYKEFNGSEKTSLQKIVGVKLDRKWFMVFNNLDQMTDANNGKGLYWNYFLHAWRTFSASPYANAIVFTSETTEITSVEVSPSSANVNQGTMIQMTADVKGSGLIDKTVTWSISGQKQAGTKIDPQSGLLTVAAKETEETSITVTATAVDGQTGTATITVKAAA